MIKGIIFDLDGVIVFTDHLHYKAWKAMADREGIYFDEVINDRLRGVSRMASLEILLERAHRTYTMQEKLALAEYKNALYRDYLDDMTEKDVSPVVRKTLQALVDKGIKLAIGSSSKNTPFIVDHVGIRPFFSAIADGNDISHSKPHPEVFLLAASRLGLKPEECLVVEDAESGIDAAEAGGFHSVGIGPASKYPKTDYPIKSFDEILKIIASAEAT